LSVSHHAAEDVGDWSADSIKKESAEAATNATTVYFTPQDENTSTTVLFLYNTNAVTSTVHLNTYFGLSNSSIELQPNV
jgi:hypothetical protein